MQRKASHSPRRQDLSSRRPFRWRPREVLDLLKASAKEFMEDKSPKQAAALAYYTLFAMGPLLVLAIGIAALVFGAGASRDALVGQVGELLGPAGAEGFEELLSGASRDQVGLWGTLVGGIVLLVSAGAVFAQLKDSLDRIWEIEVKKAVGLKAKTLRAVRRNFLSFAGVFGTGFLLIVSLAISAVLSAVDDASARAFPGALVAVRVLNVALSLAVIAAVFSAIFKFVPDARVAWRDVLVGGVITAVLFLVGQFALGYYLGAGPLATRYGAGAAVLIVLVWVYYSGMIVFFGAQITQVYANRYGSKVRASEDARPLTEATQEEQAEPENEGTEREGPAKGSRGRRDYA